MGLAALSCKTYCSRSIWTPPMLCAIIHFVSFVTSTSEDSFLWRLLL